MSDTKMMQRHRGGQLLLSARASMGADHERCSQGRTMNIRNKALLKAIFTLQGNLRTGLKPRRRVFEGIEIAPFKNDAKAAACIAADFELSWAFRHQSKEDARERGRRERENIPYILKLLEDYTCPITWATVGHLFLDSCSRAAGGLAHPEMPRPHHNPLWTGDWYMHDPCTNYKEDPCWYAPDLIQSILESPIGHEVGTHSFSHANFTPACSEPILVRREIEASAVAMQPYGLSPRSLVYPYDNRVHAYLDLLSALGITAVRNRDQRVRLSYPERTASGVYKLYDSMMLRTARHYDYLDKVKVFLATAAKRRAVFYFWFHPSEPSALFETEFRRIIQYIDSRRKAGLVWIATMAELAAYCEAREQLRPAVERHDGEIRVVWRGSFQGEKYGQTELSLIFPPLPRPRMVAVTTADGVRPLELGRSYVQMAMGRLLINMPTTAKSLHIVF
jgi:peptidoglycan/xylan/chitin deacetylase (PgdA/CDA1 family)